MKKLIVLLICLCSSVARAAADGSGVQAEYDDMVKSLGKWGFISNFCFFSALAGFGTSYYAYNRAKAYELTEKTRPLTEHEQNEKLVWKGVMKNAGYVGGVGLGLGLIGLGASIQYEYRAHQFAFDMGIKF